MSPLIQALLSETTISRMVMDRAVSRFTPAEIREAISGLVLQDRMDLANALGDAGISLYPDSEDILAMVALLAESKQDWSAAEETLAKLLLLQGRQAPVATWQHYIRVLRCLCELQSAIEIADHALSIYPGHPALSAELQSLKDLLGDSHAMNTTETFH